MPGLNVEDAKKELDQIVSREKKSIDASREAMLPSSEKSRIEHERKDAEAKAMKDKADAEAKAKKDIEILTKKDEEITDEAEKKRKVELLEQKRKEEESKLSSEEKIKRVQEGAQKRIDEITNELKQIKNNTSSEAKELRTKLDLLQKEKDDLEKKVTQSSGRDEAVNFLEKQEKERMAKYLEEDKDLPRAKRREMSKAELEEWLLEDYVDAQEWMTDRGLRRKSERQQDAIQFQKSERIKTLTNKQAISNARVLVRHPELDTYKREAELKAQGKSNEEIQSTLCAENEKYKICSEIVKGNPEKFLLSEDGPELVAAEMEKRMASKSSSESSEERKRIEELTAEVQKLSAEIAALSNSDEGINSTITRKKTSEAKLTEQEEILVKTMKELRAPQDKIDAALKIMRENRK